MILVVLAICLGLVGLEWAGLWPEWMKVSTGRHLRRF
jgi:hypothetical protein